MKPHVMLSLSTAVVLFSVVPTNSAAQGFRWRGAQGWGPGGAYARLYDPAKVERVAGEILEIRKTTPLRGMSPGVELVVRTTTAQVAVHLAPVWFLENQELSFAKGDGVEVEGSRVAVDGKQVLLAASIRKGDQVLQLRDAMGVPRWAGWRRAP